MIDLTVAAQVPPYQPDYDHATQVYVNLPGPQTPSIAQATHRTCLLFLPCPNRPTFPQI